MPRPVIIFARVAFLIGIVAIVGFSVSTYFTRREQRAAVHKAAPAPTSSPEQRLTSFTLVTGTSTFRAVLTKGASDTDWASYRERRDISNLLFVNADTGASHWAVDDSKHEIVELEDLSTSRESAPLITVVLVKPKSEQPAIATGDLLLITPTGDRIVKIASNVRTIEATNLVGETKLSLVYERNRKFFIAQYALDTLTKIQEREVVIAKLK